ncbi:DNA replication/repair protein RecF [Pseudoglutamicibacter albus]|uniref:DNA replication/repair protein RecF n=1 Tax=Pseudoglutamicibacter albus TaxID=98671 RepID=UPI001EF3E04E|nr:DNA replication/repair protein RecF [Pseudoglutamicibacter albus]
MYLTHLSLHDFRTYQHLELPLSPGTTVLVGPNGVGKTNIVEAIGYLATQDSHRVSQDAPLVRFGAERALIAGQVNRGDRLTRVEVEINPRRRNRARVNRADFSRAREALGILRSILFVPEDLELVKGEPEVRRRFLDDLVVQLRPDQAAVRNEFDRVLRQRNALLKSARASGGFTEAHEATLDVWDMHFAQAAAPLMRNRIHVAKLLAPHVAQAYSELTNGAKAATLRYFTTVVDEAETLGSVDGPVAEQTLLTPDMVHITDVVSQALEASRARDIERATTTVGPHRDDVMLGLGSAPAKGFASHGETWSLALALRLAAFRVLMEDDPSEAARPVLILDDVFAELDEFRRQRLVAALADAEQVVVTAAVGSEIPQGLDATVVRVSPGEVMIDDATNA